MSEFDLNSSFSFKRRINCSALAHACAKGLPTISVTSIQQFSNLVSSMGRSSVQCFTERLYAFFENHSNSDVENKSFSGVLGRFREALACTVASLGEWILEKVRKPLTSFEHFAKLLSKVRIQLAILENLCDLESYDRTEKKSVFPPHKNELNEYRMSAGRCTPEGVL